MSFIELEKKTLNEKLSALTPDRSPAWGKMEPQQMLEHLIRSLRIARGDEKQEVKLTDEKLEEMRAFLFSDKPMPKEVKSRTMVDEEGDHWYSDLEEAKEAFLKEWDLFEESYASDPDKQEVHPVFGTLDKEGWDQVHRKHFTHHFQQFGLMG